MHILMHKKRVCQNTNAYHTSQLSVVTSPLQVTISMSIEWGFCCYVCLRSDLQQTADRIILSCEKIPLKLQLVYSVQISVGVYPAVCKE